MRHGRCNAFLLGEKFCKMRPRTRCDKGEGFRNESSMCDAEITTGIVSLTAAPIFLH